MCFSNWNETPPSRTEPIVTAEFIDWLFKQRQETSGEKQHPLHKLDKNSHFEKDLEDNMLETLIVTFTIRQVPVNWDTEENCLPLQPISIFRGK